MKIVGITKRDGFSYKMVVTAGLDEVAVERIVYKRDGNLFNNGLTNSEAAYVVYLADDVVARIVPEREVVEIFFDTTKKEKTKTSAADDDTPDDFLGTETEEDAAG